MREVLESEIAHETPWLRLRRDRLVLPDGSSHDYSYVERPRFAIIAAIGDGRLWLVEQYRHPLGRRTVELPMGVAPGGDATPIEEGARIELREETGLTAERIAYVGEIAPGPALLAQTGALFLAEGLTPGPQDLERTEQDLTARAEPVERVYAMAAAGEIVDGVTLASLGLLRIKGLL